jgi:hypothetical protein
MTKRKPRLFLPDDLRDPAVWMKCVRMVGDCDIHMNYDDLPAILYSIRDREAIALHRTLPEDERTGLIVTYAPAALRVEPRQSAALLALRMSTHRWYAISLGTIGECYRAGAFAAPGWVNPLPAEVLAQFAAPEAALAYQTLAGE